MNKITSTVRLRPDTVFVSHSYGSDSSLLSTLTVPSVHESNEEGDAPSETLLGGSTHWDFSDEFPYILTGYYEDTEMEKFGSPQDLTNYLLVEHDRIRCRFYAYGTKSDTTMILVDHEEAEYEPDLEHHEHDGLAYQEVIHNLRTGGREVSAEDLIEMLRDIEQDPDEPEISIYSLQAMARFLIKHRKFCHPIIGLDPIGMMQAEWHIIGDGLLVMAFLENEQIHCVAQADATPESEELNVSVQLTEDEAIEEFGYLVPLR